MPDTLPINFFNMSVFLGADFIFPAKSDLPASDSICDTPRQSQHRNKPEIRSVIGVGLMEKLKELIKEMQTERKLLLDQMQGITPPEALTKKQRQIWVYMKFHPRETNYSTIADGAGVNRHTVAKWYEMIRGMLG